MCIASPTFYVQQSQLLGDILHFLAIMITGDHGGRARSSAR